MADKSGFPACTPWKNYRYPLTRLELVKASDGDSPNLGYTVESNTSAFADMHFSVGPCDIWLNDDWFLFADALSVTYKIIMDNGTLDGIKSITVPQVFIDGSAGTNTRTVDVDGGALPYYHLGTVDNNTYVDIISSNAPTVGSRGNNSSLIPLIPGLFISFPGTSATSFADDAEFSFKMKSNAIDVTPGMKKVMDGTYTCYFKSPAAAGDTVVTEPLPSGIGNKGFNVLINGDRCIAKKSNSNASWGQTIHLEGSVDGVNWFQFATLVDDAEDLYLVQASWDSNALDGEDFPLKRIKVEYETGGSPMTIYDHQYLKMAITPH